MSEGIEITSSSGTLILSSDDYTFRYIGQYSFTSNPNTDVIVRIPGVVPGVHFVTCSIGFPQVESNQVRIKPQFGSGIGTAIFYLFSI